VVLAAPSILPCAPNQLFCVHKLYRMLCESRLRLVRCHFVVLSRCTKRSFTNHGTKRLPVWKHQRVALESVPMPCRTWRLQLVFQLR